MDAVTQALQVARYSDIVEIQVGNDHQTVFLGASIDLEHGGIQWQPIDPDQRLGRHLQTKQWILPMLNDEARNNYYQQAIQKATNLVKQKRVDKDVSAGADDEPTTTTIRVLDIGTGSGLLSMMAASNLSFSRIYSLEMSTSMAELARQVIHANHDKIGGSNGTEIVVLTEHSTEHGLPSSERAQLCVSELLESGLLGEGVIGALRDAWDRLLEPDAIMVPQGARVFVAAVQGVWIQDLYGPRNDGEEATISYALDQQGASVMLDANEVVYPVHAQHVFRDGGEGDCRILTDAKEAMNISLSREALLTSQSTNQTTKVTLTSIKEGTLHGFLMWWELDLWDGITYSLEPGKEAFQDHWKPCVHPIQTVRAVQAGDTLTVEVSHNENRLFVALCDEGNDKSSGPANKRRRQILHESYERGSHLLSPERALQLNDPERLVFFTQGIMQVLSIKGKASRVLDLSDFSLCACIAARCGATRVISLESSPGDIPMTSARMSQLGNGLPLPDASFEILQCHAEQLTQELLGGAIDIVVAEPYYQTLEGWHLQEAINFYCLNRALRRRNVLADDFISVPAVCRIMACAVESRSLRSAYKPCGGNNDNDPSVDHSVCGFDHTILNEHGANYESFDLCLSMWQYDYRRISSHVELGQFNFGRPIDDPIHSTVSLPVTQQGTLDAIMIWLDYGCGEDSQAHILSTADRRSYRQCVRRMNQSRDVCKQNVVTVTTTLLDPLNPDGFEIQVQ